MRRFVILFALAACSPKDQVVDASAKPSGMLCSTIINGCSCVQNTTQPMPVGSCSPQTVGGTATCCEQKNEKGERASCSCTKNGACFQISMNECRCTTNPPDGGMAVAACVKAMMGKCCQAEPDASQSDCRCITSGMCAMGEKEVPSCAPADTNLMCGPNGASVASCQ